MAINQLQIPSSGNINNLVDQSQWQSLSNLGNVYQKAQQDAANQQAFAQFQQTGDPKALIGSGDMNLAKLGVEAQNHRDLLAQQVIENKRADINTGINQTNAKINQGRFAHETADWEKTPDQSRFKSKIRSAWRAGLYRSVCSGDRCIRQCETNSVRDVGWDQVFGAATGRRVAK